MSWRRFSLFPFLLLCFSSVLAADKDAPIKFHWRAIYEAKEVKNNRLRYGDDRNNKIELEPTLRLNVRGFQGAPVTFFSELEFIQKRKRQTASQATTANTLNFNQAWLRFDESLIPDVDLRLGRWLLRDEREWLIDENVDGVYARFGDRLKTEAGAGRVNYWQRDLLDSSTRGDKTNFLLLFSRYKIQQHWRVGGYAFWQRNRAAASDRQLNMGLRSYSPPRQWLSHWLDISAVRGQSEKQSLRGYALDGGATLTFTALPLQPRLTLGYAWGSGDDGSEHISRRYRQTGLQGNEALFGGDTRYKIYGETLDPELSNIHIFTAGTGIQLASNVSLDVVYHFYRQDRLAALIKNSAGLDAKYDRMTTKKLGSALDVVAGWRPAQNLKLEASAAWFAPSSRFYNGSKRHSPRAGSASSWWLKAEVRF